MRFWSLKTTVVPEGSIPEADSTRTSRVKPRFIRVSGRERICNVRLHARENHLSYALCTLRGTPPTETVIIPWKSQKYDRKSDQLVAPKCQKRLLADGGGRSCGRLEETGQDTEIRRWSDEPRGGKDKKEGKDQVCWVHHQDSQGYG